MPAPTGSGSGNASLLGTAWVAIRGDMSGLKNDFGETAKVIKAKFTASNFGAGLFELGAGAAAAYAPIALLERGIHAWQHEAHEASQEALALVNAQQRLRIALQTSGNTAGISFEKMKKFAEESQEFLGIDDTQIMEFQAKMVKFEHINGEAFERATKVAMDWATLYGDSLPQKAEFLGRALDNPARGMLTLRRAGINLSDTQQKLIKDFQKAGEVAKAQDVILKALEDRYGGAAKEMATPLKLLKAELSMVREELGLLINEYEGLDVRRQSAFTRFQLGVYQRIASDLRTFGVDPNAKAGTVEKKAPGLLGTAAFESEMFVATFGTYQLARLGKMAQKFATGAFTQDYWLDMFGGSNLKGGGKGDPIRKPSPLEDKDKKERTEGFMDPVMLAKRLQEGLLSDHNAKMLDIAEQSRDLLETIATGSGEPAIGVEN